jgi:hypothetical protein
MLRNLENRYPNCIIATVYSAAGNCRNFKLHSLPSDDIDSNRTITIFIPPPQPPHSPTINFVRSFFSGARSASPNTIMAARTKAQEIIDGNAVAVFSKSYVETVLHGQKFNPD